MPAALSKCFDKTFSSSSKAFEDLKAVYDEKNKVKTKDNNERDKMLEEALERVRNMIKFCFGVKQFRLRIYQRYLMREIIISSLPLIVGRSVWSNQRQLILAAMGITEAEFSTIFFSITGRRFGKTRVITILGSGMLLFAVLDFESDMLIGVFATNLSGSKRLLVGIKEVLTSVMEQMPHLKTDYVFDINAENIRIKRLDEIYWRIATAYPGNGEVSLFFVGVGLFLVSLRQILSVCRDYSAN